MPSMTKLEFRKWIDPTIVFDCSDSLTTPSFGAFSRMDWIKTYLRNPLWMFGANYFDVGICTSHDVRIKIIKKVLKANCQRVIQCYLYNALAAPHAEEFRQSIDDNLPEIS